MSLLYPTKFYITEETKKELEALVEENKSFVYRWILKHSKVVDERRSYEQIQSYGITTVEAMQPMYPNGVVLNPDLPEDDL